MASLDHGELDHREHLALDRHAAALIEPADAPLDDELDSLLFYKVGRDTRNLFDYVELERLEIGHGS